MQYLFYLHLLVSKRTASYSASMFSAYGCVCRSALSFHHSRFRAGIRSKVLALFSSLFDSSTRINWPLIITPYFARHKLSSLLYLSENMLPARTHASMISDPPSFGKGRSSELLRVHMGHSHRYVILSTELYKGSITSGKMCWICCSLDIDLHPHGNF